MNKANKNLEDARARELNDFDELGEYLKHANEMEQLAIREAMLHEAYLNSVITRLRDKKKQLGMADS